MQLGTCIKSFRGQKSAVETFFTNDSNRIYNEILTTDTHEKYLVGEDGHASPINVHYENVLKVNGTNIINVGATGDFTTLEEAIDFLKTIDYTEDVDITIQLNDDSVLSAPIEIDAEIFKKVQIQGFEPTVYNITRTTVSGTNMVVTCSTAPSSVLIGRTVIIAGSNAANRGIFLVTAVSGNTFTCTIVSGKQVASTVAGTATFVLAITTNNFSAFKIKNNYGLKKISNVVLYQVGAAAVGCNGIECGSINEVGGFFNSGDNFGIFKFYNGIVAFQNSTLNVQKINISLSINAGIIASRGSFVAANSSVITRNTAIGIRAENGATIEATGYYVNFSTTNVSPNAGTVGNYGAVVIP